MRHLRTLLTTWLLALVRRSKLTCAFEYFFLLFILLYGYSFHCTYSEIFFVPMFSIHDRVIQKIFEEVDKHIKEETLIKDLNMSALPILYEQFVKLIKLLVCILNL